MKEYLFFVNWLFWFFRVVLVYSVWYYYGGYGKVDFGRGCCVGFWLGVVVWFIFILFVIIGYIEVVIILVGVRRIRVVEDKFVYSFLGKIKRIWFIIYVLRIDFDN